MLKLNKKLIDKSWELHNKLVSQALSLHEAWENEESKKLSSKILPYVSKCLIILYNDENKSETEELYYSFYRIYSLTGKYLFALPGCLPLPESKWEEMRAIITREPKDPSKSNDGGDYYEGFRIWRLTHPRSSNPIFKVQFSWALYSKFESQCSDEPEVVFGLQKLAEKLGDINIAQYQFS